MSRVFFVTLDGLASVCDMAVMKINIGHTESHHRALTDPAEPKTLQATVVGMHVV